MKVELKRGADGEDVRCERHARVKMTSRVLVEAIGRMDLLSHFAPSTNGKAMARAGVGDKPSSQLCPLAEVLVDIWSYEFRREGSLRDLNYRWYRKP